MYLKSLSLVNFKNYTEAQLELSPEINVLTGLNGQGKTNLLDAIHYLSSCKSFLNPIDKQSVRTGTSFFMLNGQFFKEDKTVDIRIAVQNGHKKKVQKNKKLYEKLIDHIGQFPVVIISPYDTNLIVEGSETRRKFMDSIISQYDRSYLDNLVRYQKVLQQRNALLRQFQEVGAFDGESLHIWNEQLIHFGTAVHDKRSTFVREFIPLFQRYFQLIADGEEGVSIVYESSLNQGDFAAQLNDALPKDRATGYSTVGTHRDDLAFLIDERPVKKFGSQGQQKSFLVSLKLAQFEMVVQLLRIKPILLLDDIFDKLDHRRVEQLIQLLSNRTFGQVFITDTDLDRIEKVFHNSAMSRLVFEVTEGKIEKTNRDG